MVSPARRAPPVRLARSPSLRVASAPVRRVLRVLALLPAILLLVLGILLEVGSHLGARVGSRPAHFAFANGAPPSFAGRATRIAFLGDVQQGIGDVSRPLVEALARERADVVVSHGDLASHGEAPYYGVVAKAFEVAGLSTPMLVAPGNHDIEPDGVRDRGPGRRLFEERVGPRHWTFRAGPVLVVGIDDGPVTDVEPEMLAWLDRTLAAAPGVPWLLVCHRPPRLLDLPGRPVNVGCAGLVARVEARPPVAVVCGHLHADADETVNGVRYYVNAHGGDVAAKSSSPPDFRIVMADVREDGTVDFRPVSSERRWWLRVEADRLCVKAWVERRKRPWAWVLAPSGLLWLGAGLALRRARGSQTTTRESDITGSGVRRDRSANP